MGLRLLPAALLLAFLLTPPHGARGETRTLFIILDAAPYRVIQDLTGPLLGGEALFPYLKGPVPLISTFPTSTSVAMRGMLKEFGMGTSPGYEARFFDWKLNKVRGGGPVSYYRIDFPWREFFDWTRKGPVSSAFQALHPVRSGIDRVERAIDAFLLAEGDRFWVYILATDWVGHLQGPEELEHIFAALDAKIRSARLEHPDRPFHVVIFSDHGMAGGEPMKCVWEPVRDALEAAGFRYRRHLEDPMDVVLTPFGLVSNFEAYTFEPAKDRVAEILTSVEGVDLCSYCTSEGWIVESRRGRAHFRRRMTREGIAWSYDPVSGDPLDYLPLIHRFQRESGLAGPWLPDRPWFEWTVQSEYPDAFHRLSQAFELVENPASVICSLRKGYMYGARRTERLSTLAGGTLRWTHGALYREASIGFLMSDVPTWTPPRIARFDTAFLPFLPSPRPDGVSKANRARPAEQSTPGKGSMDLRGPQVGGQ